MSVTSVHDTMAVTQSDFRVEVAAQRHLRKACERGFSTIRQISWRPGMKLDSYDFFDDEFRC